MYVTLVESRFAKKSFKHALFFSRRRLMRHTTFSELLAIYFSWRSAHTRLPFFTEIHLVVSSLWLCRKTTAKSFRSWLRWFFNELKNMKTSSILVHSNWKWLCIINDFMKLWNINGVFIRPDGMTQNESSQRNKITDFYCARGNHFGLPTSWGKKQSFELLFKKHLTKDLLNV